MTMTGMADGRALSRVVHPVVVDGAVAFHGGDHGQKLNLFDTEVTLAAHRIHAEIPSYFIDPARACPATTYYESVEMRGRLVRLTDPGARRRVVVGLMGPVPT